jgi:hypothetical protein
MCSYQPVHVYSLHCAPGVCPFADICLCSAVLPACLPAVQTLQEHAPDEWASLPDLQQKRQAYYDALEAPNRTMIGQKQVCVGPALLLPMAALVM